MAYKTLSQMTTNSLDPVRGWWDERQLSRTVHVYGSDNDDSSTRVTVLAGQVGYLNTSNEFVKGSPAGNAMPLFARGGTADMDAVRYEGNLANSSSTTSGTGAPVNGSIRGTGISCLVGTGAYELGTTAYDGSIASGALLMASTANAGKIATLLSVGTPAVYGYALNATPNTNQIVGIATSASAVKNQYGVGMLYFYVNWWPAI